MSIFEIGMLICFGVSWPVNIAKAWKAGTAANQSVVFLLAIELGYVCGIIHKILYNPDVVLVFYCLNFAMVLVNICIYLRNWAMDRRTERESNG